MTKKYATALEACRKANTANGVAARLDEADTVIVGYSGGADSSLLLRLMLDLCPDKRIVAAHLNHGIRGDEADCDEAFCRAEADALGVSFVSDKVDVPSLASASGEGIEEAARHARYAFFGRVLSDFGDKSVVATAHNSDDNAETVIMNMLRGCGLNGLGGIPAIRDRYVRPMLALSSAEVRLTCEAEGIAYRVDSTNAETDCKRNYIRHEIMPRLRRISDNPEAQIAKMCASVVADEDYISSEAEALIADGCEVKILKNAHSAVLSRIIMAEYRRVTDTEKTLSKQNIADVISVIRDGHNGDMISLPECTVAVIEADRLVIRQAEAEVIPFCRKAEIGKNDFPEHGFAVYILPTDKKADTQTEIGSNIYKLSTQVTVGFDKIEGQLIIRSRLPGDTIRYGGMTRKLKKLLSDKKLPTRERDRLPIIADESGIVYVPGFPPRDGAEAKDGLTIIYTDNKA